MLALRQSLTLMATEPFSVIYDGPALQGGMMDVATLGPALIALGEVIAHTNFLLNGELATVTLRISASSSPGSFPALLELYQHVSSVLPETEIKSGLDILCVLGMAASDNPSGAITGVIELWKRLKGAKPRVIEQHTDNRTATIDIEGESHQVSQTVLNQYGDMHIHYHLPAVIEPVRHEGITEFRAEHAGVVASRVDKTEAPMFRAWLDESSAEIIVGEHLEDDVAVQVISFHARPGYKWRFVSRLNGTFTADMLDEDFVEAVHRGDRRLSGADMLRVVLRTRTLQSGAQRFEVVKVIDVIRGPVQQLLV